MGYYSQVGVCLETAKFEDFKVQITLLDDEKKQDMQWLLEGAKISQKEDFTCLCWSFIKWYDSFLSVSRFTNFLTELEWEKYLFLRVGEDFDDTEIQGGLWDNPFDLQICREIQVNVPD